MTRRVAHCHKMVAEVAKGAAHELYDNLMMNQQYYEAWKKQNPEATPKQLEDRFVARNWGKCLDVARATLALMLRSPTTSEKVKDEIMDALVKDSSLMRGRERNFARMLH